MFLEDNAPCGVGIPAGRSRSAESCGSPGSSSCWFSLAAGSSCPRGVGTRTPPASVSVRRPSVELRRPSSAVVGRCRWSAARPEQRSRSPAVDGTTSPYPVDGHATGPRPVGSHATGPQPVGGHAKGPWPVGAQAPVRQAAGQSRRAMAPAGRQSSVRVVGRAARPRRSAMRGNCCVATRKARTSKGAGLRLLPAEPQQLGVSRLGEVSSGRRPASRAARRAPRPRPARRRCRRPRRSTNRHRHCSRPEPHRRLRRLRRQRPRRPRGT